MESSEHSTIIQKVAGQILQANGAPWEQYLRYAGQIRKEYAIYPDLVYKPGRKKVLIKFLERDFIYKTPDFRAQFEKQARLNLQQEIETI